MVWMLRCWTITYIQMIIWIYLNELILEIIISMNYINMMHTLSFSNMRAFVIDAFWGRAASDETNTERIMRNYVIMFM